MNNTINRFNDFKFCEVHPNGNWGRKADGEWFERCSKGNTLNQECREGVENEKGSDNSNLPEPESMRNNIANNQNNQDSELQVVEGQALDKPRSDTEFAKQAADFLVDIIKKNGWSKKLGGQS